MGLALSRGPSTTWPVALEDARKKNTGHFGRDDMFFRLGDKTQGKWRVER
jgi:hypothetical protein